MSANMKKALYGGRKNYRKIFISLAGSLDGILGILALALAACAFTVSRFMSLRVAGVSMLVLLAAFWFFGILLVRRDPKTKNWKLKRMRELPMISKKRCFIIPAFLLAFGILLWFDLFNK